MNTRIEIFRGHDKNYYWHLKSRNGKIVCASQSFPTRQHARRAAYRFHDLTGSIAAGTVELIDLED